MENRQLPIVVGLIVNEKSEILFTKRNEPSNPEIHGKWEFPGGKIEYGEEPEAAVIRECKEETGIDVEIVRFLPKVYTNSWKKSPHQEPYQVFILSYECKPVGGLLGTTDSKISEIKYFLEKDINYAECLPKMKEIIHLLKL